VVDILGSDADLLNLTFVALQNRMGVDQQPNLATSLTVE